MKPLLILAGLLLLPVLAFAQTSGTITDLGGGTSIYSDSQGNSGMIQNHGGGYSTFSGTQGHGRVQDLGGGLSMFSYTPRQRPSMQPVQPLPMPSMPSLGSTAPAALLYQGTFNSMEQMNRR